MKRLIFTAWLLTLSLNADAIIKSPPSGSNGGLAPIATGTVLGNSSGSTAAPSALTALPPAVPVYGADTPGKEGAIGNDVADDTTALQACATSNACQLQCFAVYKITVTIFVPGMFHGCGFSGTSKSRIDASAVAGPAITVGTTITDAHFADVGGFEISGTGTTGFACYQSYESHIFDIHVSGTFSYNGFLFEKSCFSFAASRLTTDAANIGSTLTFSGSVGGATTGTISSGTNPGNGTYIMVFGNGEQRSVVISSGTTATWSTALAAGSITTAAYGAGFFFGGGSNAAVCNLCYTGGSAQPFNFIIHDFNGSLGSAGLTLNSPVAQNGQVGYFFGTNANQVTINGLYCEDCVLPIAYGNAASSIFAGSVTINGATMSGPLASHPQYANRFTFIDAQLGHALRVNSPVFAFDDGKSPTAYPLTFSGGTQTTAPKAYAFANAAGVIKGVAILAAGTYTTGNPPTGATCPACSGSPTFTVTAGTAEFGQLGVTGVTVTAGGSGNTLSTGMVAVTENKAGQVSIDSPSWPWGLSGDNNGISPIMAKDSINASGSAAFGYAVTNDGGQYDPAGAFGRPTGLSVLKAPEYVDRYWVQYVSAGGALATYSVPVVAFP